MAIGRAERISTTLVAWPVRRTTNRPAGAHSIAGRRASHSPSWPIARETSRFHPIIKPIKQPEPRAPVGKPPRRGEQHMKPEVAQPHCCSLPLMALVEFTVFSRAHSGRRPLRRANHLPGPPSARRPRPGARFASELDTDNFRGFSGAISWRFERERTSRATEAARWAGWQRNRKETPTGPGAQCCHEIRPAPEASRPHWVSVGER